MKEKTYKISRLYQKNTPVPYIRLIGKWLQVNGFDIGDKIKITTAKDILLITKK